ncbi:UPAR/Ly6 domain-containing protein crok-like [Euwallacea fornicatus]|uniref:UPAR/Ly6 domain-containing protein crok-like n=1 Tax=Euwallacea fornicatus TaxID=995702 RepID=UPI0033901D01
MFVKGFFPAFGLLIIHTVFLVQCTTDMDHVVYTSEDYWKTETPLRCYDCNSLYDPRCGDPFDSYSIGIVNCSEQKPPEHLINPELPPNQRIKPTVCRKIIQKVDGYKRVIRECGYIQDQRDDKQCIKRAGTFGIEVRYCACTKSLCNDGTALRPSSVYLNYCVLFGAFSLLNKILEPF